MWSPSSPSCMHALILICLSWLRLNTKALSCRQRIIKPNETCTTFAVPKIKMRLYDFPSTAAGGQMLSQKRDGRRVGFCIYLVFSGSDRAFTPREWLGLKIGAAQSRTLDVNFISISFMRLQIWEKRTENTSKVIKPQIQSNLNEFHLISD